MEERGDSALGSTTPDNQKLKDIFGAVFERDVIRFAVFSEHDITLNPNWFSRDDYREIAELFNTLRKLYAHAPSYSMIISALHAKAKQMPRESPVRKNVLKAVGFLNTVTPLTKTQTEFVVDHLSEFARRRSLYLALMESADAWSNGKYDEIMTRIQGALEDSSRYSEPSLGTDFREARARIRAVQPHQQIVDRLGRDLPAHVGHEHARRPGLAVVGKTHVVGRAGVRGEELDGGGRLAEQVTQSTTRHGRDQQGTCGDQSSSRRHRGTTKLTAQT